MTKNLDFFVFDVLIFFKLHKVISSIFFSLSLNEMNKKKIKFKKNLHSIR